ncbi:MAG: hypothetical protein M1482_00870 [Chloroflexi bacterium]|nr:hypothetical protein [Chloroflexota bacterium]
MEKLSATARWLELLIVAAMAFLFGFFTIHRRLNTGYFTDRFGPVEMLCLYGPILVALAPPVVRAVGGNRNPGRPWEAAARLSLAIGSLELLLVFPFEFSHLADVLPEGIRFALAWVTNDIGRIVLAFQVILGPFAALSAMSKYFALRRQGPAVTT